MNNKPKKSKIMKRIIQTAVVALVCLVAFQVSAVADNDKPINVTQMPATAQQTIKNTSLTRKWLSPNRKLEYLKRVTT